MTLKDKDIIFIEKFCAAVNIADNVREIGPETSVIWDWHVMDIQVPTKVCTEDMLAYIADVPIFYDCTYDGQLTTDDMEHMLGLIRVALGWDRFDCGWNLALMPEDYENSETFLQYCKEADEYAPMRKECGTGILF